MKAVDLRSYGWAPGPYINFKGCRSCKGDIHGAKGCMNCQSCAERDHKAGVNLRLLHGGLPSPMQLIGGTVGSLIRQRDELHETTNRYLERVLRAEYRVAVLEAKLAAYGD